MVFSSIKAKAQSLCDAFCKQKRKQVKIVKKALEKIFAFSQQEDFQGKILPEAYTSPWWKVFAAFNWHPDDKLRIYFISSSLVLRHLECVTWLSCKQSLLLEFNELKMKTPQLCEILRIYLCAERASFKIKFLYCYILIIKFFVHVNVSPNKLSN